MPRPQPYTTECPSFLIQMATTCGLTRNKGCECGVRPVEALRYPADAVLYRKHAAQPRCERRCRMLRARGNSPRFRVVSFRTGTLRPLPSTSEPFPQRGTERRVGLSGLRGRDVQTKTPHDSMSLGRFRSLGPKPLKAGGTDLYKIDHP
jgi:hypothetical protein